MQPLPKEGVRYAFLLILLFAIAALATKATIDYIVPLVGDKELHIITVVVCSLTLGLMLISGAFGVWAIRFSAEAESLRRLGRLVDAMTYIRDGVLALDRQGNITGQNPAARELLGERDAPTLSELCPGLADEDINLLVKSAHPEEVECSCGLQGQPHTLRFRSQPSKGVTLLLVSDVTKLADTRTRHRRAAYLQLVGHIAQGVANDFNDLLCGISGHASLIGRSISDSLTVRRSADAITDCANRGVQLAGRLLELSQPPQGERPGTTHPATGVDAAIDGLAADLPPGWNINRDVAANIPPTSLTITQVEHIVRSLGLLATEAYGKESQLSIELCLPSESGLWHTDDDAAGLIIVAPTNLDSINPDTLQTSATGTSGLLESVVTSMLQQAGGKLDSQSTPDGIPVYRVLLPHATADDLDDQGEDLPIGLEAYIAGWHVLICQETNASPQLQRYLKNATVTVENAASIVDALSRIESGTDLAAILINREMLGEESEGLLRAIIKLCPQAGLVVQDAQGTTEHHHTPDLVVVPTGTPPAHVLRAMIEARSLARARHRPA